MTFRVVREREDILYELIDRFLVKPFIYPLPHPGVLDRGQISD
jgi:hypothetical protein